MKQPAVYIMANKPNGTLYLGVTSDLPKRAHQHRTAITKSFTQTYNCKTLVYFELLDDMRTAITREKQLKAGNRQQKLTLIEAQNPTWRDLYDEIL